MDVLSTLLITEFEWGSGSYASSILAGPWGPFFGSFLGETEGPFLGADLRGLGAGSAGGVKEAPRRRRGCLDAADYLVRLERGLDRPAQSASAFGSSRSMIFWKTPSNAGRRCRGGYG